MKRKILSLILLITGILFASPFNEKLSVEEYERLQNGELLIRNINYKKNISLKKGLFEVSDDMIEIFDDLNPKYLAEVIQFKNIEENPDLPQRLEEVLNNISEYAGIPYYSERAEAWYNLYDSAEITETIESDDSKIMKVKLQMEPFGTVEETITIKTDYNTVFYIAENDNKLRFNETIDCVWPQKMKISILLFQYEGNWVLYGIGGVNAPRIPFFTQRIQTSFINRIKTFCSFIFQKL